MSNQHDIQFVSIFQPRDTIEAGMIRSALQQEGVNCYVDNENFSAVQFGGTGIGVGTMKVMVPHDQLEQAKNILEGLPIK